MPDNSHTLRPPPSLHSQVVPVNTFFNVFYNCINACPNPKPAPIKVLLIFLIVKLPIPNGAQFNISFEKVSCLERVLRSPAAYRLFFMLDSLKSLLKHVL